MNHPLTYAEALKEIQRLREKVWHLERNCRILHDRERCLLQQIRPVVGGGEVLDLSEEEVAFIDFPEEDADSLGWDAVDGTPGEDRP